MRGVRVARDTFYIFDWNEERSQLVVSHSNAPNSQGRELFHLLAKHDGDDTVEVMDESAINKALQAA